MCNNKRANHRVVFWRRDNAKGQQLEAMATGMDPICLTQGFTGTSQSAGYSMLSELTMHVDVPRIGGRVDNTLTTTTQQIGRARPGRG